MQWPADIGSEILSAWNNATHAPPTAIGRATDNSLSASSIPKVQDEGHRAFPAIIAGSIGFPPHNRVPRNHCGLHRIPPHSLRIVARSVQSLRGSMRVPRNHDARHRSQLYASATFSWSKELAAYQACHTIFVSAFAEPSCWCAGAVLNVAGCAVCASAAPSSWRTE